MKTLIIRNFGPIRNVEVTINPITIFIGPQGCGKSTISKIYTICQDVQWTLDIIQGGKRVMEPFDKFGIIEFFKKDTYIRFQEDDDLYATEYSNGSFHLDVKKGINTDSLKRVLQETILKSNKGLLERLGTNASDVSHISERYSELLRANARAVLYVPAERNLIGNLSPYLANMMLAGIPIQGSLMEYMSIYERAKSKLNSYRVPFLSIRYAMEDGRERLYIGRNQSISFQAGSSGIQSILPMLMVIKYSLAVKCFNCFVIEEPEQNLYPMNQLELLRFLLSFRSDYIITTHSPYLLSALNVFLLAGKLAKKTDYADDVYKIVPHKQVINPKKIAVYSINDSTEQQNVKSLINPRTGLVDVNSLDGVSELISSDFEQLLSIMMRQNNIRE